MRYRYIFDSSSVSQLIGHLLQSDDSPQDCVDDLTHMQLIGYLNHLLTDGDLAEDSIVIELLDQLKDEVDQLVEYEIQSIEVKTVDGTVVVITKPIKELKYDYV